MVVNESSVLQKSHSSICSGEFSWIFTSQKFHGKNAFLDRRRTADNHLLCSKSVSSKARYGASSQKVLSQATHYEEVLSTDIKLLVSMLVSRENHLSVHA